ncbi:MAG: S41 family peptidase [Sphingorhabdus sp.]
MKLRAKLSLSLAVLACFSGSTSAHATLPDGLWQQRGYGRIHQVKDGKLGSWTIGKGYCYKGGTSYSALDRTEALSPAYYVAYEQGGITPYHFDRLTGLPPECGKAFESKDPFVNFDSLWQQFYDHYGLFDLKKSDWLKVYREFRPRVTATMTDDALWAVITEMLQTLDDGHVNLSGPDRSWYPKRNRSLQQALNGKNEDEFVSAAWERLPKLHVRRHLEFAFENRLAWGEVDKSVAYLAINKMRTVDHDDGSLQSEVSQIEEIFDTKIGPFLAKYPKLIVDLRVNDGGADAVALAIASRLAAGKCLAFRKISLGLGSMSTGANVYTEPAVGKAPLETSIVILTSPQTASASEIFLLAMKAQPNVQLIGERSWGVFSDEWAGRMPNGWAFTMSNERYVDPAGRDYEGVGIDPDIEVQVFKEGDLIKNSRPSFERGLRQVRKMKFDRTASCK